MLRQRLQPGLAAYLYNHAISAREDMAVLNRLGRQPLQCGHSNKIFNKKAQALVRFLLTLGIVIATNTSHGAVLEVGPNRIYKTPSAAAEAAKDGDSIKIAPGKYVDCAVWRANNLVIEGAGPRTVIGDKTCLGKGIFVISGAHTTVRNLTLARAHVPERNGAGIRLDAGNLLVERVRFIENENGILGGVPGTTITIRNSEFDRNGYCGAYCAHAVYAGHVEILRVENSRFIGTRIGHSIKSRAQLTEVVGCTILDGAEGTSSYLIDAPNGGTLIVRNNNLQKGRRSDNPKVAITIGEEGITQPTPKIAITNNKFRNDGSSETVFVRNTTSISAMLESNNLSGFVKPLEGYGTVLP